MAAIVTKLKLAQILRKMLPADVDMRSVDAALKVRPKSFNRLHMTGTVYLLVAIVVHRTVLETH